MKKPKIYIVVCCLLLAVALVFSFLYYIQNPGIQSLRFYRRGDSIYLKINYFDCKGYSVEPLKDDEMILMGEREVNPADILGENVIKIDLLETDISDKLNKDYKYFEAYDVNVKGSKDNEDVDIKFMLCPSAHHSVLIYIGFGDAFNSAINENTKISQPLGSISPIGSITIKLGGIV